MQSVSTHRRSENAERKEKSNGRPAETPDDCRRADPAPLSAGAAAVAFCSAGLTSTRMYAVCTP